MRGIMWFREDLRLSDNTALYHASKLCEDGVIAVYLIDINFWQKHHMAPCRMEFLMRGVAELSQALNHIHIPLIIRHMTKTENIPGELYRIAELTKASAVFFNHQHEVNELHRDQIVRDYLIAKKIPCHSYDDQTILPQEKIITQQGNFYSVFTPYKRAWQRYFLQQGELNIFPLPRKQNKLDVTTDAVPTVISGIRSTIDANRWPAGEKQAHQILKHFIQEKIFLYAKQRDFPALAGTSQLSPYLAAGMISARQCFEAALLSNHNELDTGQIGAITWMNELIWRDFYKAILKAAPRVSMHRAFKPETEKLKWHYNEEHLSAWKEGRTGFPIVDAAMRQLNTIGWMHNRLRMVVAMFFSKNLFFDWRIGEEYFISHLIDGDLSANNGGWQWSASTGTDAAPYFRIFNPIRQSERFDPNGEFIREYCPELRSLTSKSIHAPPPLPNYPKPIINLEVTRKQAIEAFKKIMS